MSVAQVTAPGRGTSPLMSNNPFRNKVVAQPPPQVSQRPISTNPFLDLNEVKNMSNGNNGQDVDQNIAVDKTADIFSTMKVQDDPNALQPTRSRQANPGPRRPEVRESNSTRSFPRPPGHKPSMSEEEQRKIQSRPRAELDIFADPTDTMNRDRERRPRRNSESSVRDKNRPMDEEERRRRERKNRESKRVGGRSGRPNKKLDVIDKLDVTSIYGMGLFHHDGPFDACNPHRNRKKEKYAPMQAFPKDSINMVMGGSGPVNKRMDYDKFHGYGQEAHIDFNEAAIVEGPAEQANPTYAYNPTAREAIHGDESVGLGTSTFLEGAPASRAAIQRRESEYETQQVDDRPGLSRKKSLAQKIRGVRPRDRLASPGELGPASPPLTGQSDSAVNPFFRNYDQKESTSIQFAENQPKPTRARAPSSPKRNELERRNTAESGGEDANKPSGLLGRMKSLKTSKRPVRRDTSG